MGLFTDYAVKKQTFNVDTPLVEWVRKHPLLQSNPNFGFVRTDIDMVWYNYIYGLLMLVEDKSRGATLHGSQRSTLAVLDQALRFALCHADFSFINIDPSYPRPAKNHYCGLHVVRFENVGPTDGQTFVDNIPVTVDQLGDFFQFKWTPSIQVYQDLANDLNTSDTLKAFMKSANHIKKNVPKYHPEFQLLNDLGNKKKIEIARKAVQHV